MKTIRITDSRRSIVEEDEKEFGMKDTEVIANTVKEDHIYIPPKLKNIIINSHGVLDDIRPGVDRITFSFKNYFDSFKEIQSRLSSTFTFTKCYRNERNSSIYKYTSGSSSILLERRAQTKQISRKPWHIWHTLTITDPNHELQLTIKEILLDVANADIRKHIPHQISLSQVEFSLDFYATKDSYLKPLSILMGRHPVLRHTRGISRTFYNYQGTAYQGRDHNVRKGPKGTRKYPKNEHGSDFVRLELQCNHSFLVNHSLTIKDLPLKNDRIDVLNYIDLRYGLNDVTLDKLCKALSNKHFKCTRSVEFSDQIPKERFYYIFKELIELKAHREHRGLNYTPVPDQIHYFKVHKMMTGITHQTDQFFPKMSWSDFFKLVIDESTTTPTIKRKATSSSNINSTTYIDPEPEWLTRGDHEEYLNELEAESRDDSEYIDESSATPTLKRKTTSSSNNNSTTFIDPEPEWLTINDHEEYLDELEAESKDDTEYELLDNDNDRHAEDIIDEFDGNEDQLGVISSETDDFEHTNSTLEKNQTNLCTQSTYTPKPIILPSRPWMDVTFKVARVASEAIDYEYCPWVRDMLAGHGIDDSMYSRYLLGYNPDHYHIKCSNVEFESNNYSNIRIPAGLTIPYIKSFDLLKLVIIKIDGLNRFSRHVVSGGCTDLCYTIDHGKCAFRTIVVVDELDAIYINQSLGFNYNVIALGHPDAKPDCYAMDILDKSKYIIIALGNKQGGDTAAQWWKDNYGQKARILPIIEGKNFSQTFTSEDDLSSWALTILTHKNPSDFINRPTPQPWW